MTDTVITRPDNREPVTFSADELGWLPWLQPLAEVDLTEPHWAGSVDLVLSAAFFNWANRLMLSIGESAPAAA